MRRFGLLVRMCGAFLAALALLLPLAGGGGGTLAAEATPVVATPDVGGTVVAAAESGTITVTAEPNPVSNGGLVTYLFQGTFSKVDGTGPFFVQISLPAALTVTDTGCWGTNVVFANPCVSPLGGTVIAQMATTTADGDYPSFYTIEITGTVTGTPGDRPIAEGCVGAGTYGEGGEASTCDSARTEIAQPGTFSKTVDKETASAGDTVTYTISFDGWTGQDTIAVTDTLPDGFTFGSASCSGTNVTFGTPNCGGIIANGLFLLSGSVTSVGAVSGTVTITGTVHGTTGFTITDTASLYLDPEGSLNEVTPVASDDATVTISGRPTPTGTVTAEPTETIAVTATPTSPRNDYTPEVTPTSPRNDYTPEVTPTSPRNDYTPEVTPTSPRNDYTPEVTATTATTTTPESSATPTQDPGTQTPVPPTAPAPTVTPPSGTTATVAVSGLPSTGQGHAEGNGSSLAALLAVAGAAFALASLVILRRRAERP